MAATYRVVVAIFGEERPEESERASERARERQIGSGEGKKERKRSLTSVFVYRESGRAFFQRAGSRAGCFMAIVCARQMAQKRDRMLPLAEPSGLKYDRGANGATGPFYISDT